MIGAIEDAILARLKAASDAGVLGYKIATLGSLQGQLDDDEALARFAPKFPAVLIAFAGCQPEPMGRGWRYQGTWTLVIAQRNLRNERAGRHGAAGEVGSYQLVEDACTLLAGQSLGLDIAPLEPGAVTSLWQGAAKDQQVSLYALDVHAAWDQVAAPESWPADSSPGHGLAGAAGGLGLADYVVQHSNWDPPPVTTGPALPDDAHAAATDHVEVNR